MSRQQQTLPAAFRLVRQLLAEGPRPFHEILKEGVVALPASGSRASASSSSISAAVGEAENAAGPSKVGSRKTKGRKTSVTASQAVKSSVKASLVPDDHPFISANFLKTRILPILHSQNLIQKTVFSPPTAGHVSTPSERAQILETKQANKGTGSSTRILDARGNSTAEKPIWLWRLAPPLPETASSAQAGTLWDTESHWDRLCSGEVHPSKIAFEFKQVELARVAERKEQLVASGKQRRTEREIMALSEGERVAGLTTRLERLYLNKRRGVGRPAKERKMLGELQAFAEARTLGEQEAQSEMAL